MNTEMLGRVQSVLATVCIIGGVLAGNGVLVLAGGFFLLDAKGGL
jgi:hypothetical protein